jgi:DNA modification methylase
MIKREIGKATLYCADCKDVLPLLKDIDSCVTDPPYGLSFMGKGWDYDVPGQDIWSLVFSSLKQGSHLLSFFGSRTYHRGALPIEDAGFEIRDQLMWIYGSGFPKSHNIGKAVDKLQGNEREVIGTKKRQGNIPNDRGNWGLKPNTDVVVDKGNSPYEGWGTALKPAHEPIVMARKPIPKTIAENVLEHGTGGINIDECRVGNEQGRYPANVMHDGSESVQKIFPKTSKSVSTKRNRKTLGSFGMPNDNTPEYSDEGTAARYFYCPKASKKDRDEGLDGFVEKMMGMSVGAQSHGEGYSPSKTGEDIGLNRVIARKNTHPTVKPTELMKYLCTLVTPKEGIVLDPFMGSGSTGKAAIQKGFRFVGIEMNEEYFEIACSRIEAAQKGQGEMF